MEPKGLDLFSHILLIHPPLSWAIRRAHFAYTFAVSELFKTMLEDS